MKIKLIAAGKTEERWLQEGISGYQARINHYVPFAITELPALKNTASLPVHMLKSREAEQFEKVIQPGDKIVLLDENGKEMRSADFAVFLNKQFVSGPRNVVFVVGGPFGFDESFRKKADFILSLSKMTFSHQMVRLFFTEQLYRALTILRGESYHHE